MNINLHIERLVLDGLPLEARDGALAQTAVTAELLQLLSENGIPAGLQTGFNRAHIPAPALDLKPALNTQEIGTQIGKSIYASFAALSNGHEK